MSIHQGTETQSTEITPIDGHMPDVRLRFERFIPGGRVHVSLSTKDWHIAFPVDADELLLAVRTIAEET